MIDMVGLYSVTKWRRVKRERNGTCESLTIGIFAKVFVFLWEWILKMRLSKATFLRQDLYRR